MVVAILAWINFYYLAQYSNSTLWFRLSNTSVFLFFITYYFFIIRWLLKKEGWYKSLGLAILIYGFLFGLLAATTNLVISGSETIQPLVTRPIFQPFGWWIFYGFVIVVTLIINLALLKEYFDYSNERRTRILYFLIGLIAFAGLNIIFNVILPVFFNIYKFYELGNYSVIFLLCLTAYAIIRQELFGIKVILTQTLIIVIAILLLWQTIVALPNWLDFSWKLLLFLLFVVFGIFLARSVRKEIKQREEIASMAEDVKRAYVIEKKAKEELEKLDKFKDQFLMTTQHNLRTPLTSMMGYSDLLLKGFFGKQNKKTTEVIQKFQALTQGMIRMVNNFLDMAQFQLGKSVVILKPGVDVLELMNEIIQELQFKAESKGVYVKLEKPEKIFTIEADREKLKAAIFNIVDNAVKYTEKGGVDITIKDHDAVKIIVKDTGIGIKKEKLPTIFEDMFERSEEAKKVTSLGSGVGLYLSGQIIKAHNGKVWADSEGVGNGSTFHIELPIINEKTIRPAN